MFGRNQKRVGLTLAVTCLVGCAGADYRVRSPVTNGPIASRDVGIADAKVAPAPSILPQTHFAAAKLFESQGMPNKAIRQYRKAIAVNHHYVEARERLALILSRIGRHEEAVRTFRGAVAIKPHDPALLNNLGFEMLLTGKVLAAEKTLQEAIRLDRTFARAYVNLGIAQGRQGRFDDALSTFEVVLPEADAYYNIALIQRGEGNADSAVATLRHVLTIDPDFTAARQQLDQIGAKESGSERSHAVAAVATPKPVAEKPSEVPATRVAVRIQPDLAPMAMSATPVAATNELSPAPTPPANPQRRVKTADEAKAWKAAIAMVASVLDARQPAPARPKPAAPKTSDATPPKTKPLSALRVRTPVVKLEAVKPKPTAPKTVAIRIAPTDTRPEPEPDHVTGASRIENRRVKAPSKTTEHPVRVAQVEPIQPEAAVPAMPTRSATPAPSATPVPSVTPAPATKPRPADAPAPPIAGPTRTPAVVELLDRRYDVAGFQTRRPDLDDPIEILFNEINCINEARTLASRTPEVTADDDTIDLDLTDPSEAMTAVPSAWLYAVGSIDDVLATSAAERPVADTASKVVLADEPCEEALLIDYVPVSDPTRVMGEFTLGFDPSLPVVFAEESFVPAGYDGPGFVLTSDNATPGGERFVDAEPNVAGVNEPCEAALVVDYGPVSDPTRVTDECSSAFDPFLRAVFARQTFVPAGYDGPGFVLTSDNATPGGERFTCVAVVDEAFSPTRIVVNQPVAATSERISSVDRAGVLRDLDEQLAIVRNEIACLDSQEAAVRMAKRPSTSKRPDARLVSKRDAETKSQARPRRPIEATDDTRVGGAARRVTKDGGARKSRKATGTAPLMKRPRSQPAKPTAAAGRSWRGLPGPSLRQSKAFERLEGLTQIVANEIRCLADEALEDSTARRATDAAEGIASAGRSPETSSRTAHRSRHKAKN